MSQLWVLLLGRDTMLQSTHKRNHLLGGLLTISEDECLTGQGGGMAAAARQAGALGESLQLILQQGQRE